MTLLEIRDLSVIYRTHQGTVQAVDRVSLDMHQTQHLGIIGESGCGKTTLLRALIRVLPRNGKITSGQILFKGRDLLTLSEREMRQLRWREIAMIPQASMDSLNPVHRVGRQLEEILTVRGRLDRAAARRRAVELFEMVGLDPARLANYPHEFSGGMKQRAVIAMALALQPSLLIADEPVTALDVIVQHQVLEVLRQLEHELNLTILLITHDISVVAQLCDTVAVMYAGQMVEQASAERFFATPSHPYSLGLQHAFPHLVRPKDYLISIEGYPPDLHDPPQACRFAERCPFVEARCKEVTPTLEEIAPNHRAACLRAQEMDSLRQRASDPLIWLKTEAARQVVNGNGGREHPGALAGLQGETTFSPNSKGKAERPPLVEVRQLSKRYHIGGGLAGLLRGQKPQTVYAVNQVSFTLRRGESLGLAGESGCGKTTTGKLLVKLLEPSDGQILFDGQDASVLPRSQLKGFRRRVQLMFQNPFEALNPRFTLYRSLAEPLLIHGWRDKTQRLARIIETLEYVNLRPAEAFLDKYPHQLSGGQLQRVVLARALVLRPDLLIADEPVSMLDVSVRAGILNTMKGLARKMGLTTLYISHDLSLLQYTCERIAIMYLGHLVEIGPARDIISQPRHPYTQALISAVPVPDPALPNPPLRIQEGVPHPTRQAVGCPFVERCPEAMQVCQAVFPPVIQVSEEHQVLCHLYGEHASSPRLAEAVQERAS